MSTYNLVGLAAVCGTSRAKVASSWKVEGAATTEDGAASEGLGGVTAGNLGIDVARSLRTETSAEWDGVDCSSSEESDDGGELHFDGGLFGWLVGVKGGG